MMTIGKMAAVLFQAPRKVAFFALAGIVTYVSPFELDRVSSGSMEPTLLSGDWVLMLDASGGNIGENSLRQEIISFHKPIAVGTRTSHANRGTLLIKRVIGVANDTIYMRRGSLCRGDVCERLQKPVECPVSKCYWDAQPFGDIILKWHRAHAITGSRFGEPPPRFDRSNWGPIVVPIGEVFVLGDNRETSEDSREFGFVVSSAIRSRKIAVVLSMQSVTALLRQLEMR